MDFEFERKWKHLVQDISKKQGEPLDLQSIIFLIGVQELNKGYLKLNKNQKIEVMHIAMCTLLEPFGYYQYIGHDDDGWPHFESRKKLPHLGTQEQERLMKQAVIHYFESEYSS